jgi:hypothetical protein
VSKNHPYYNVNCQSADKLSVEKAIAESKENIDSSEESPTQQLEKPVFGYLIQDIPHDGPKLWLGFQ